MITTISNPPKHQRRRRVISSKSCPSTMHHFFNHAFAISLPLMVLVFLHPCTYYRRVRAFSYFPSQQTSLKTWHRGREVMSSLQLQAMPKKRQTYILDGAELSYYVKSVAKELREELPSGECVGDDNIVPDVAPCSIQKRNRVGTITFIVLVADKDTCLHDKGERVLIKQNQRFIGIEAPHSMNSTHTKHARPIISVGSDTYLYQDSIAIIPSKISDVDAISTATAALLGVHCSLPSRKLKFEESGEEKNGNVVIVGGGEYALYLLRALSGLDVKATLVSARPTWSLPSVDELATSKRNKELIEILPPSVGSLSLGFALAIGEFDTLIDTLGDQMGLGRTRTVLDEEQSARFQNQLEELHGCDKYVSTITRSQ
eukprot:scaffold4048_cov191-Alexandrium_tamarense.AAC.1